jgi:hypothetical protein
MKITQEETITFTLTMTTEEHVELRQGLERLMESTGDVPRAVGELADALDGEIFTYQTGYTNGMNAGLRSAEVVRVNMQNERANHEQESSQNA